MTMMHHYRRQQYLSEETLGKVQTRLERLARDSNARLALLADPTGQELAFCGQVDGHVAETISALSAGQVGASHELVKALRLSASFTLMIREGQDYHYYLSAPADRYILLLVAPSDIPLGWVRHLLKQSHEEFGQLLAHVEEESDTEHQKAGTMSPDFVSSLLDKMDGFWDGE
jgi:predicted regulator of Ras-like GTPase activity (Roadblock/LC7/MglB family)